MQYENEAKVLFHAKSVNESFSRIFAAGFFASIDPTISEIMDIKTAISEAVTNAIIHAYDKEEGKIELSCAYIDRVVYIEVVDYGKGIEDIDLAREPLYTSKPEMERSGMGFTIMETFMDYIKIESVPNKGTRIFMKKMLSGE